MSPAQPNILLVMADQMAAPALPFHGHPVVQAPNLSRLAEEGVVFDSAYCSSPLCAPSRASLVTGQFPSRLSVYDNAAEFPASIPTFGHYLRDLGYHTCLCGKMHFIGPDQHRVSQHVSLVDILPTLVDLAASSAQDLKMVDGKAGQSLLPLLEGNEDQWPNAAVREILCEGALAPCFMIRRGRYKYVYSKPDPDQLYDLESDPDERENLAPHQAYDSLRSRFLDEVMARWDPEGIYEEVLTSQRQRRLVFRSLSRGKQTFWDFQPYRDASRQYVRSDTALDELERRARFPKPDRMSIHEVHN
jgi:arylsulfatase A-like enzyme